MTRKGRLAWAGVVMLVVALQAVLVWRVVSLGQQLVALAGQVSALQDEATAANGTLDDAEAAVVQVRQAFDALLQTADPDAADPRANLVALRPALQAVEDALEDAEASFDNSEPATDDEAAAPGLVAQTGPAAPGA